MLKKTAFYAEYKSKGTGANTQGRVSWSKQLTKAEYKKYQLKYVLAGKDNWKPNKNIPKIKF